MRIAITKCPNPKCSTNTSGAVNFIMGLAKKKFIIKKGYYKTKWNRQSVPRYKCKCCGVLFSTHTLLPTYKQKKPFLNKPIAKWYVSNTTQRRIAQNMGVNRKTVIRKFLYMAAQARKAHEAFVAGGKLKTSMAQFDEMETFEHTRLKPLSITLAVRAKTGQIIEAQVATMNCHGQTASLSQAKYGWRNDTRGAAREDVLKMVNQCSKPSMLIVSDKKTNYPKLVAQWVPHATLQQVDNSKPKRTQTANRKNQKDELFRINLTASKIRHDLSRMARKVWVTTKKAYMLQAHLDLYIAWINRYPIA